MEYQVKSTRVEMIPSGVSHPTREWTLTGVLMTGLRIITCRCSGDQNDLLKVTGSFRACKGTFTSIQQRRCYNLNFIQGGLMGPEVK